MAAASASPRVAARLADSRRRILEAARIVVAEQGFAAAQVAVVAAVADVATGSVYRHFPSKSSLFSEMLRAVCDRELTVIRATGVSVARLAGTALLAGLILVLFEMLLGEFLAPPLQQAAREHKAFSKLTNVSFGGSGAWVRDGDLILDVAGQTSQRQFGSMQIFELSPQHRLLAVGRGQRALAVSRGKWLLSDYTESRFADDTVTTSPPGQRLLESNVTAGFLGLAIEDPKQLTSRALWRLISYFRANALDSREYQFAFWSRIARTVAVAFAVLLAIPFVLGSLRSAGAGTRMMMGLLLGLAFFLLQRLIESSTVLFNLNPVLLAWLPTTLLALVTLGLLARAR